ncbi:transposase [Nocardiopsis sinuspersici]|uniref:transposase n=1 Tax=Nocardiopsis sinuspersici TaxID=501010 RepID=UPI003742D1F7
MPTDAPKGKKWADHRKIINAILFRTHTDIPWREPCTPSSVDGNAPGHGSPSREPSRAATALGRGGKLL